MMLKTLLTAVAIAVSSHAAFAVEMGDDGLHKPDWLRETFLDLSEDLAEAEAEGKRLMILVEQRGCSYCRKMHEEVFVQPQVEQYIRDNYFVVQLNMFGDLEVTDFDGTVLSEKEMVNRWGVLFTPTTMFFPEEVTGEDQANDAAVAVMPGAFSASTTIDLLTWVYEHGYDGDEPFQKYHARMIEVRGQGD